MQTFVEKKSLQSNYVWVAIFITNYLYEIKFATNHYWKKLYELLKIIESK